MLRLHTGYFYHLGSQIHPLTALTMTDTRGSCYHTCIFARSALEKFTQEHIIPAPLSKAATGDVIRVINEAFPPTLVRPDDADEQMGLMGFDIAEAVRRFENVLHAELGRIETFVTTPKGIYDVRALAENAENMFSHEVCEWLSPQAVQDIRHAGRCLAFELPTAAGFHIGRAVEEVARKYHSLIASTPDKSSPTPRSWGQLIKELGSTGADPKIVSALDQMRDLHRNPISHPDSNLSIDDALTLLGIAQSAITAMAGHARERHPTAEPPPRP